MGGGGKRTGTGQTRWDTDQRIREAVLILRRHGGSLKRSELVKELMRNNRCKYGPANHAVNRMCQGSLSVRIGIHLDQQTVVHLHEKVN